MKELESRWQDLGIFIREQRQLGRISLRQLARTAGVSNPYLSQIERGLKKPSAEILAQIAKGLRISAETLYVQAGILEDRSPGDDLDRRIMADPYLDEAQRQALVAVYRSFRHDNSAAPLEKTPLEKTPLEKSSDAAGS